MSSTSNNSPAEDARRPPANSRSNWKWLFYPALTILVLLVAPELHLQDRLKQGLQGIETLGPWSAIIFIGLYVIATVLFTPGSALTLGAGALFGVAWGSLYVSIGSTLGATAAFLIGRYLARDAIARKIGTNERFTAIDHAVEAEGWKIVGLTRLSPMFPFTLLNYAFGLTRVRLSHYVVASWIGMMPGTVMYVYLGSLAKAATGERTRTTGEWVLYGVGLLATILVTLFVTRVAKQALANKLD